MTATANSRRRIRTWVGALTLSTLAGLQPALSVARPAVGAAAIVESLASQAMAAFKAGQFERAIELYLAAYMQDQSQAVLLFNAARVAHSGRLYERAEELYQRVLEHPQSASEKKTAAQTYLTGLRRDRAEATAARARQLSEQGKYQEAAVEFRSACRQLPERVEWLLAAARASSHVGELLLAEKDYVEYLERAMPSPTRGDAEAELAALRVKMRQAEQDRMASAKPAVETAPVPLAATPKAAAQPPLGVAAQLAPAEPKWPMAVLVAGSAMVAGGAALWGWTWSEERALQEAVQAGATPSLTYDEATSRAGTLETRYRLGMGIAAAGAVVGAVAAYRMSRGSGPAVAIAPFGKGVALVGHW